MIAGLVNAPAQIREHGDQSVQSHMAAQGRNTQARRWAIVQEVQRRQRATVAELSASLGVSQVSIRNDLEHLHLMGLLRRVHGGAEAITRPGQASQFHARLFDQIEAKRAIGAAAAARVQPGEVVILDAGTTVLEIARHLPAPLLENGGLTVITRSLVIAGELRHHRQVRLLMPGGVYMHDYDAFSGSQVESALQGMHAGTLYIGTDGVVLDRGLTTDNALEAGLYRVLARCADRIVVVTDSTKIGLNKLQVLLSLDQVHALITDDGARPEFLDGLRRRGIEVLAVPRP